MSQVPTPPPPADHGEHRPPRSDSPWDAPPTNATRMLVPLGCLGIMVAFGMMCVFPLFLADVFQGALRRLHLDRTTAVLSVIGIFVGSVINLPVWRIERKDIQVSDPMAVFGLGQLAPWMRSLKPETVIAVNVGGGLIPLLLATYQIGYLIKAEHVPVATLAIVSLVNIGVCYWSAKPVPNVGIMMPGFLSPLVAVGLTWLLLGDPAYAEVRPGIAFVAGVMGPLVGADLLHLKDITRMSIGLLSIGGAGTFDGIVLSGIMAAWFA